MLFIVFSFFLPGSLGLIPRPLGRSLLFKDTTLLARGSSLNRVLVDPAALHDQRDVPTGVAGGRQVFQRIAVHQQESA